jgi:ribosomal protein S18 acetylase RimI-like enzyme
VPRLVLPPDQAGEPALRAVRSADDDLLLQIYASTRADELDLVDWAPGQRVAFERMQFMAQRQDWAARFPHAVHSVVEVDGVGVGRIVVEEDGERILIVDLALLPSLRGRGVGTTLLQGVLDRADARALPVRLHVEPDNRARRLYLRLGFEVVERGPTHLGMERAGRR